MFAYQHSHHHIELPLKPAGCHFEQPMLVPFTLYAKFKAILFDGMFNRGCNPVSALGRLKGHQLNYRRQYVRPDTQHATDK